MVKDDSVLDEDDDAWDEWKRLVNSVADEFDELAKLMSEDCSGDDWQAYRKKEKELIRKAFADLAYIFDELNW